MASAPNPISSSGPQAPKKAVTMQQIQSAHPPVPGERTILGVDLRRMIVKVVNGLSRGHKIKVYFRGTGAYTTGKIVVLPNIRDLAEIPWSVARGLIGYAIHEIGHVLLTDWDQVQRSYDEGKLVRHFANAIEDYRIERELCKRFPGAARDLTALRVRIHPVPEDLKPAWLRDPRASGPLALTWTGSVLNGFPNSQMSKTLAMFPPAMKSMIDRWTAKMDGISDTEEVVTLAIEINKEVEAYIQAANQAASQKDNDDDQDSNDDQNDSDDQDDSLIEEASSQDDEQSSDGSDQSDDDDQSDGSSPSGKEDDVSSDDAASDDQSPSSDDAGDQNQSSSEDEPASDDSPKDSDKSDSQDASDSSEDGTPQDSSDEDSAPKGDDSDDDVQSMQDNGDSNDDGNPSDSADDGASSNGDDTSSSPDDESENQSGDDGSQDDSTGSSDQTQDDASDQPGDNSDSGNSQSDAPSDEGDVENPVDRHGDNDGDTANQSADDRSGEQDSSDNPSADDDDLTSSSNDQRADDESDQSTGSNGASDEGDDAAQSSNGDEENSSTSPSDDSNASSSDQPTLDGEDADSNAGEAGDSDSASDAASNISDAGQDDGQSPSNADSDDASNDAQASNDNGGLDDYLSPDASIEDHIDAIRDSIQDDIDQNGALSDEDPEASEGEVDPKEVIDQVAEANSHAPDYQSSDGTEDDDSESDNNMDSSMSPKASKHHYNDARFSKLDTDNTENLYSTLRATAAGAISTTARTIRRLLASQSKTGVIRNRRDGQFDIRNMNSIIRGTGTCYKREFTNKSLETLLVTLIDFSGSMSYSNSSEAPPPLDLAMTGALAIEEATRNTSINTAIYSYSGFSPNVQLNIFKEGKQNDALTKKNIGAYQNAGSGCTPTAEAMAAVLSRMENSPEQRKILLVLTDGDADDMDLCHSVVEVYRRRGIEIVAIGIDSDGVSEWAPIYHVIRDVKELPQALLSTIDPRGPKKKAA